MSTLKTKYQSELKQLCHSIISHTEMCECITPPYSLKMKMVHQLDSQYKNLRTVPRKAARNLLRIQSWFQYRGPSASGKHSSLLICLPLLPASLSSPCQGGSAGGAPWCCHTSPPGHGRSLVQGYTHCLRCSVVHKPYPVAGTGKQQINNYLCYVILFYLFLRQAVKHYRAIAHQVQ